MLAPAEIIGVWKAEGAQSPQAEFINPARLTTFQCRATATDTLYASCGVASIGCILCDQCTAPLCNGRHACMSCCMFHTIEHGARNLDHWVASHVRCNSKRHCNSNRDVKTNNKKAGSRFESSSNCFVILNVHCIVGEQTIRLTGATSGVLVKLCLTVTTAKLQTDIHSKP